jgi:hypothetical protein
MQAVASGKLMSNAQTIFVFIMAPFLLNIISAPKAYRKIMDKK